MRGSRWGVDKSQQPVTATELKRVSTLTGEAARGDQGVVLRGELRRGRGVVMRRPIASGDGELYDLQSCFRGPVSRLYLSCLVFGLHEQPDSSG